MAGAESTSPGTGPSTERERSIDALRGLCLLGIAIVNVPWIGLNPPLPDLLWDDARREALAPWDLVSALLVEGLCEGKFYPQFAALFGFGAGLLIARGRATYVRRLGVLFVFGVLHSVFGWWGDILLNYSLLGLVLLVIERRTPSGILAFSVLSLIATTLVSLRFDTWFAPEATSPEQAAQHAAYLAQQLTTYRDGDFLAISSHRWDEMMSFFSQYNWSYRLNTVVMGSFGLWLQRSGAVTRLTSSWWHGRIALALLVSGVLANASLAIHPGPYIAAGNLLAMGYAAGFLWLANKASFSSVVSALIPIGRCAISGYLGQTATFTLFFYGYGLAMYGSIGPTAALGLAVSVWMVEVILARAWMSVFALGPVEWLWRSLTYGRVLRIRRDPATVG